MAVRYYEKALRAFGGDGPEVETVLRRHLAQHKVDRQTLIEAAEPLRGR